MLDSTVRDVLGGATPDFGGGCLVCYGPKHSMPTDWIPVEPWQEVLFGRSAAQQVGVLVAPGMAGDTSVSRLHASVVLDDRGAYLVDLGSTNGTWLNGWRLPAKRPAQLVSGSHFRVGQGLFAWLDARPRAGSGGAAWPEWRVFEQACEWEFEKARRSGGALTVLSILDAAGERLLGSDGIHPDWSAQLRSGDVVSRAGADEWVVLMPQTGLDLAGVVVGLMHGVRSRCALELVPTALRIGIASVQLPGPGAGVHGTRRPDVACLESLLSAARSDRELREDAADVAAVEGADEAQPGAADTEVLAWADAADVVEELDGSDDEAERS